MACRRAKQVITGASGAQTFDFDQYDDIDIRCTGNITIAASGSPADGSIYTIRIGYPYGSLKTSTVTWLGGAFELNVASNPFHLPATVGESVYGLHWILFFTAYAGLLMLTSVATGPQDDAP